MRQSLLNFEQRFKLSIRLCFMISEPIFRCMNDINCKLRMFMAFRDKNLLIYNCDDFRNVMLIYYFVLRIRKEKQLWTF